MTDLSHIINRFRLDLGHDYRKEIRSQDNKRIVAIKYLGIDSGSLDAIRKMVPSARITEHSRIPAAGHIGYWVRCDIEID